MFKAIKKDIQCVFERDPAARTTFEVLTNYPGLHALWLHRISHKLWRSNWKWLARSLSTFSRWLTGIEIHPGAVIGAGFFIDHGMGVVIGETAEIGNNCTLYHGVTLGGTSWKAGKRHPTLKDNVVVGAGAKVLGPIEIGSGARIGSNAVVVKNVPDGQTMVGIPARAVKTIEQQDPKRSEVAKKFGFDAYAVTDNCNDPIANTIHGLLDHMHAVDKQLEEMNSALRQLGQNCTKVDLPVLPDDELSDDNGAQTEKPRSVQNVE